MNHPPAWSEMRLAALAIMAVYLIFALALFPREAQFLRGVEQGRQRTLFIVQDLLLQGCALVLLLPLVLSSHASRALFITAFSAFGALWAVVLWVGATRYAYTWNLLNQFRYKGPPAAPPAAAGPPNPREERDEP
jgi:hypothetical protein